MVGTDSELRDLNSAPEQQQDIQSPLSSSSEQNSKDDSVWMNMEEFLSSLLLADEEDQDQGTTASATSSNDQPPAENSLLQRQCHFSIPELLRTKTADEVRSEIINYYDSNNQEHTNPASPTTFRKITLENFLARAGIVPEEYVQEPPPPPPPQQTDMKERCRLRLMKKNRETVAQFRAKKQASILELEQELYLLREENKHLKLLMKYEEEEARAKAVMQPKANEKPTTMRRVFSSPC